MENIINDSMKKESKMWESLMITFYVLAAMFPLVLIWNEIKITEFILCEVFLILIGSFFLYGYLYTYKSKEKIILKTLFKNIEIKIKDIKAYNCKRYKKSEFYQFLIFYEDHKTLINTRYKDALEKFLNSIII